MMRISRRTPFALAIVLACFAPAASAQQLPDEPPPRATQIPTEGFWPTDTMIDRIIDRISDDMADQYHFDDEQLGMTRDLLKQRIPAWLKKNRPEIQTLTNQFIEAQLNDAPPEIDAVAQWSQRVLPLMGEFKGMVVDMTDDMREYMTDDQQLQLDSELAGFETGVTMVTNKLGIWADGGYDPESEWLPPGHERHEREVQQDQKIDQAMEQAKQDVLSGEKSPEDIEALGYAAAPRETTSRPAVAAAPPDEWTQYTLDFIKRYELDDGQRQKAMVFLRGAREQRDAYLHGKSEELERVQAMLVAAKDEAHRKAALEQFDRLNAPVDRQLQQLKDKLNTLPTRAQRRAAAEADRESDESSSQPTPAKNRP